MTPRLVDITGSAALCRTGTDQLESIVRITTSDCSAPPCTQIDRPVAIAVSADSGDINGPSLPLALTGVQSLEIRGLRLIDPEGELLATTGASNVVPLVAPAIRTGRGKLAAANDDRNTASDCW